MLGKLFHLKPELRQRMADQSELPHGDPATMGHGVKCARADAGDAGVGRVKAAGQCLCRSL